MPSRRVSLHIKRREVSITLTIHDCETAASGQALLAQLPNPATCSVCGAAWLLVSTPPEADIGVDYQQVCAAFVQSGLHPPLYADAKLWICSQSMQRLHITT